jgi:hypothetical protein
VHVVCVGEILGTWYVHRPMYKQQRDGEKSPIQFHNQRKNVEKPKTKCKMLFEDTGDGAVVVETRLSADAFAFLRNYLKEV